MQWVFPHPIRDPRNEDPPSAFGNHCTGKSSGTKDRIRVSGVGKKKRWGNVAFSARKA